jgi:carbon-monoxide dehydrogenase small subunit
MTLYQLLRDRPDADEAEIRSTSGGNLCQCAGYRNPSSPR